MKDGWTGSKSICNTQDSRDWNGWEKQTARKEGKLFSKCLVSFTSSLSICSDNDVPGSLAGLPGSVFVFADITRKKCGNRQDIPSRVHSHHVVNPLRGAKKKKETLRFKRKEAGSFEKKENTLLLPLLLPSVVCSTGASFLSFFPSPFPYFLRESLMMRHEADTSSRCPSSPFLFLTLLLIQLLPSNLLRQETFPDLSLIQPWVFFLQLWVFFLSSLTLLFRLFLNSSIQK